MADVSTIAVNVIANTGGFSKGLDKAEGKAKGFGKSIGGGGGGAGLVGSLGKLVPVMAIATTAAAAAAVAYRQLGAAFDRIDESAKKASRLGITSESFRALTYSAEIAGASMDDVNDVLKTMQKNLGDAILGTGEAVASLNMLGLSADDLATMDADEQFRTIADAISKIENPALQAALAAKIFGEGSQKMMDMIRGGSAAMNEQSEELDKLQGKLDATDDKKVADMKDAWLRVMKAVDGLWQQLSVLLAPALEMIADVLSACISWVTRAVEWFRRLGDEWNVLIAFASPVVAAIKWISGAKEEQTEVVEKLTAAQKQQAIEELKAAEAEQKAIEDAAKAREELEKRGAKLLESMRTPMEMYNDTIADLNMMLDAGVISWETYSRAVAKAQEDIKKSEEFAAKEIDVAERQAVGVTLRGHGAMSIQQKQQRALEKIREEERLQLKQLQEQTQLLNQLNQNVQTGTVVTI